MPAYLSEPHWMPLAQLKPDPDNANAHDATSIEAIARSFLRFGMRKNIVADKNKVIRAGNGAYEALLWIEQESLRSEATKQRTLLLHDYAMMKPTMGAGGKGGLNGSYSERKDEEYARQLVEKYPNLCTLLQKKRRLDVKVKWADAYRPS